MTRKRMKPVRCIETGQCFKSLTDVARAMFPDRSISSVRGLLSSRMEYGGFHFKPLPDSMYNSALQKGDSICFACKNTNLNRCSWFNPYNPTPVAGWTATKKQLTSGSGYGEKKIDGYIVKKCPNFEKEDWYKWEVDND